MLLEYDVNKAIIHMEIIDEERQAVESLIDSLNDCYDSELNNPAGRSDIITKNKNQAEKLRRMIFARQQWLEDVIAECRNISHNVEETLIEAEYNLKGVGIESE